MRWSVSLPVGLQRLAPRLIHATARLTRPLTIGVRAVILDESDAVGNTKVFLVRHSYVPGWHLPGGAVEAGETVLEALVRETREECAIAIEPDVPRLFGLYFNRRVSRRDHVAVYVARDFRVLSERDRIGRSWKPASTPLRRCPRGRRPRHGRAWPKCWTARLRRPTGDQACASVKVKRRSKMNFAA